jgi:uncharacterized spore protein YtfJ
MDTIDVEKLVKTTLGEIEKVLGSKAVIGEPIKIADTTIIPLLSVGFGFGGVAGSGTLSKDKTQGESSGAGGAAGGGGVKPIAIIIIDKNGARIESIKGGMASALEKIGESVPEVMERIAERWGDKKKED